MVQKHATGHTDVQAVYILRHFDLQLHVTGLSYPLCDAEMLAANHEDEPTALRRRFFCGGGGDLVQVLRLALHLYRSQLRT